MDGLRGAAYQVGTAWLPAIWLAFRLSDASLGESVAMFAIGYLCFIAIYEIGYLVNDIWDAARGQSGRRRVGFPAGPLYVILFVLVRLGTWGAVAYATGWIDDAVWLGAYAALAAAFSVHNLVRVPSFRASSFYQLATLRFTCPIVALVPRSDLAIVLLAGVIFYTYLRLLSYLDSKDLLDAPERNRPIFALAQTLMFAPVIGFVAYATHSAVFLELYVYYVALFSLRFMVPEPNCGKVPPAR